MKQSRQTSLREFIPITGYEDLYMINRKGQIYSLISKRILKPALCGNGYLAVALWKNGKSKTTKIHRMVAKEFIPNPKRLREINHKDGIKTNNNIENLEWCTPSHNRQHAYDNGLNRLVPVVRIDKKENRKRYRSIKEAGEKIGINASLISNVLSGRCQTAGGYKWEKV